MTFQFETRRVWLDQSGPSCSYASILHPAKTIWSSYSMCVSYIQHLALREFKRVYDFLHKAFHKLVSQGVILLAFGAQADAI